MRVRRTAAAVALGGGLVLTGSACDDEPLEPTDPQVTQTSSATEGSGSPEATATETGGG